jgi:hypothetical protein
MPDSDDESQSEASYGSHTSDSEHEEEETNYDRKQTVLALLAKLKEEITKM